MFWVWLRPYNGRVVAFGAGEIIGSISGVSTVFPWTRLVSHKRQTNTKLSTNTSVFSHTKI